MRWSGFFPLIAFTMIAAVFAVGLTRDPSVLPSALIDKPAPTFDLPGVEGLPTPGLSSAHLASGEPVLLNIFASWCAPCRVEHPILEGLAARGEVPIYAIAYKDRPQDAKRFLDALGNPYSRIGLDLEGKTGINFGVYGVPETYIIRGDGRIAYRHVGPLMPETVKDVILPLLKTLREEAGSGV